ncbi:MAG: 3-deoxy-D-manno-octulosonic acid transferase [Thermodesulfobacteriota bacterium]
MSTVRRFPGSLRIFFQVYEGLWRLGMPWLRHHPRLAEGYSERTLESVPGPADLWIQSASVGESYLCWELLKRMQPARPIRVLTTATTRQGIDVLHQVKEAIRIQNPGVGMQVRYFPLDSPSRMARALDAVRPGLMVLVETELWPGLLFALKNRAIPAMIVNGRMSVKSVQGYQRWPALWRPIGPSRILAVSEADAARFRSVFPKAAVAVMDNIKFDRLGTQDPAPSNRFQKWFPSGRPFLVLGSVRREEEDVVENLILRLRSRHPEAVIGLFPRHLHRVDSWEKRLASHSVPQVRRSMLTSAVSSGAVVLWDRIGELNAAYGRADAVFVGGSLASVGGQNFLEPLMCGIRPVIGPSWENFQWVGAALFEQGLVRIGRNWEKVAELLSEDLADPPSREDVRDRTGRYIQRRQGGARQACRVVESVLNGFLQSTTLHYPQ